MDFVLNEYHRDLSDEELLSDVKRISALVSQSTLSHKVYRKCGGKYGAKTFRRHFGSWNTVLSLCKMEPNKHQLAAVQASHNHSIVETDDLLADVKNVATQLGKSSISSTEYRRYGKYSSRTYYKRFSSWNDLLIHAGLQPYKQIPGKRIKDEDMFIEIENLWIKLGRQPTSTDIKNGASCYSLHAYTDHFGGWRGALQAFISFINEDDNATKILLEQETKPGNELKCSTPLIKDSYKPMPIIKHKTARDVNLRLRFRVMQRDNFKCCICGASPATNPSIELQIDHIQPWSKGGETVIENLQTLCTNCNLGKSNL